MALDAAPGTGYRWELAHPLDEGPVRLVGSTYAPPARALPGLPGPPARELWTFAAVSPGETTVTLHYRRPGAPEHPPARVSTTAVAVVAGR